MSLTVKKKNKIKNETWLHIIRIDQSVVRNQYVARGSPSDWCEARADSASGESFKLDSNMDMKENYPWIMGKPSFQKGNFTNIIYILYIGVRGWKIVFVVLLLEVVFVFQ